MTHQSINAVPPAADVAAVGRESRRFTFPHQAAQLPARVMAGFLAVEVGVHRWDLESVLDDHVPLPADLAIAAIDRVFDSYTPRLAGKGVSDIWKRWPPPWPGVETPGSQEVLKRFLAVDYIPDPRTTPAH